MKNQFRLKKKHIENQFIEGMTWENHGDWHVDHIIPCSCFDLANSVEQTICRALPLPHPKSIKQVLEAPTTG